MLAIAGGKGGVGKTTTTLGLAAALDGPAVTVDADVDMPNLHSMAGVDREPTLASCRGDEDVDRRRTRCDVGHRQPSTDDVVVVPAPFARDLPDERAVATLLDRLPAAGRHVLVDCPAGASPDAVAPMRVADAVLLVSTLCGPALRDAAKTAAMARAVGSRPLGVVLTRTHTSPQAVEDLLGCPVLASVPPTEGETLAQPPVRDAYARLARAITSGKEIL